MINESILIEDTDIGLRLDKYLSEKLDISREHLAKID